MKFRIPIALVCLLLLTTLCIIRPPTVLAAEEITPEQESFFETKIRPLLIDRCYECHSEESGESGGELLVDGAHSLRTGGVSGPAIVPGSPEKSLLIKAIRYEDPDYEMPPTGKMNPEEIRSLEKWIAMGAPDPRKDNPKREPSSSPMDIDPQTHWAFNPPKRFFNQQNQHSLQVANDDRDLIDAIARDAAKQAGIPLSGRADERDLVIRLYYDLTGLLPTYDQIESYLAKEDPNKWNQLVDHLLASPQYAERMARHWMDVARYADTVGYALAGRERRIKGSERYREWLIRAYANDMPLGQMIRFQLAGDRFDPENADGNLDAMGFLTIGRRFLNKYDTIDDRIDVITRGFLGLTVACARCHDHKFDPIPTKDYYSLLGILTSSESPEDAASPLALVDKQKPRDSPVFVRGQQGNHGEIAPRQYLTALRNSDDARFNDGSGRLELAERLAAPDNPLVARVYVNRVWMHLIGRPIIDSTSDFGIRTQPTPLVPLLDELAAEFVAHGSTKRLVKRIVTSRIYAQSAEPASPTALQTDPDNQYAARANRRRRDFESMRDALLQVSEQLDRRLGGPSVEIHLASPSHRRSLYAMVDRQNLPSLFRTFDFASPDAHTPKRLFTTVPQQALFLMNHQQMGAIAKSLARQVAGKHDSIEQQVSAIFKQVLLRQPNSMELDACETFMTRAVTDSGSPEQFRPQFAWRYGTTPVNKECSVSTFRPFPHYSGTSWQEESKLPAESVYRYASLSVENGHPGKEHAVVRRWIAPADGQVTVSGMIGHRNNKGDGIEMALWIGGSRIWRANHKSNNRPFADFKGTIKKGETVDFVVSPRESDSFDSFFLRAQISLRTSDGVYFEGDSRRDFSGSRETDAPATLNRLEQLAHTVLLSNEFLFVD